ncbi:MAG: hypothetical protein ACHQII_03525 [Bacteroidia bacterium]
MRRIVFTLMTCITLLACGQTKKEEKDVSNTKTDKHINIPGTRLFIIPPKDFTIATSFIGLKKHDNSEIQIYDLVGGNYYTNAATFSKEKFEQKGAKVFEYKENKFNGFPAKYIFMQGDPNAKAISLVFGDTTFSTMIMAIYPSIDDKVGEEIQKAIQTIYYDKSLKIDPFATASFTLDENKSIFKFSKAASGMFMYTKDGVDKVEPLIVLTTIPKDQAMTAKSISEMMVSKIEQYGLTDKQFKNISTANVNGQPAYEVEVYGKMQDKSCVLYQLVVTGQDKAITIQALVKSDFDNNLREIRNLAQTIKLK